VAKKESERGQAEKRRREIEIKRNEEEVKKVRLYTHCTRFYFNRCFLLL